MAVEAATTINQLDATKPGISDLKSEGDDHLRLLKATIKATFPNVTGVMTADHTSLSNVNGLSSAVQPQIDSKAPIASPAFTGTPTAPTAVAATNTTQLATTAMVQSAILASTGITAVLPAQSGNTGKFLKTDGTSPNWADEQVVPRVAIFTASGTWVCPAQVIQAKVTVVGGGGGSGHFTASQASGAGGGGAAAIKTLTVVPGTSYTVTIGAGGAGGAASSAGSAGGSSSISGGAITTVSANGGFGGAPSITGGAGGATISGHDLAIPGGAAVDSPQNSGQPTPGGASWLSGAAAPSTAGRAYGGGGGGASPNASVNSNAGGSGVVIIEY